MRSAVVCFLLLLTLPLVAQKNAVWEMEASHTTAGLRGIHNVGAGVAWASGTDGTVLRTEDGGYLWQTCAVPPGAEKLDFRGVWAWDAQIAVVMSSGPGDLSRVYKTTDGCGSWKLLYTNPDPKGFWDAIAFLDKDNGFLLGDPVDGRFAIFSTTDGGATWHRDTSKNLAALPGEGAFAASNSALAIVPRLDQPASIAVLFGTGGSKPPRLRRLSTGRSGPGSATEVWTETSLPLASGNASSGVFSLSVQGIQGKKYAGNISNSEYQQCIAVGGDYQKPNETTGTAAWSADGGKTWKAAEKPPHGYRSAVAWDTTGKAWVTVGTNGSDVSYDDGRSWQPLDNGNWNALSLPWVVGPRGRIGKLVSLYQQTRQH